MAPTSTQYRYIQFDDREVPFIEGSSMKVVELITSVKAYGWNPEELLNNYPHLTLSKIHSALSFYWDHQSEIDAAIAQREHYAEEYQTAAGQSPFAARMRAQGLLP
jgi:uncharacterized protein (DUF433 family)